MLSPEQNALLTQTGPGTPGGRLFRRYWHPVALASELPPGSPPMYVRILGEDLVLFRDDRGEPGLLGLRCPHRGADLSYGRIEGGGLRCLYHGWLFDRKGHCLERPNVSEPRGTAAGWTHLAYPCVQVGDALLAYLGKDEPPPVHDYAFLRAPESHRFSTKLFQACNYLQANEGNLDPSHLSFLHRNSIRPGGYAEIPGAGKVVDELYQSQLNPHIECEPTPFGLRIFTTRSVDAAHTYLRVTNFIMPNLAAIAGFEGRAGKGGYTASWHVPIDDTCHFRYDFTFQETGPVDPTFYRRDFERETEGVHLRRQSHNRYMQDRGEMAGKTFSGMGTLFVAQDTFAVQSQGEVQDRSQERLTSSDVAIVMARRMLEASIRENEAGKDPVNVPLRSGSRDYSGLVVLSETVGSAVDPSEHVKNRIEERRAIEEGA
jgi:phthalate 4,5-dioxygenase oxygenase subunit